MEISQVTELMFSNGPLISTDAKPYILPLIADKTTVIRVFPLIAAGAAAPRVTGKLHVYAVAQDGVTKSNKLADPTPDNGVITAITALNRDSSEASLNFTLPPTDMPNLTAAGYIEVEADITPLPGEPSTPIGAVTPQIFEFVPQTRPLRVAVVPFCYMPPANPPAPVACPPYVTQDDAFLLKHVYPAADNVPDDKHEGIFFYSIPPPKSTGSTRLWTLSLKPCDLDLEGNCPAPDGGEVLKAKLLKAYYGTPNFKKQFDQLIAWLPLAAEKDAGYDGISSPPWSNGKGRVALVLQYDPPNDKNAFAHEIGHNLGLRHTKPITSIPGASTAGEDDDTKWPYASDRIQNTGLVSPLVSSTFFDLMSYDNPATKWVAPYTYAVLYQSGFQPHGDEVNNFLLCPGACPTPHSREVTKTNDASPSDFLVISGSVQADGTAGTLDPAYHIVADDSPDPSDPNGAYCLQFSGAGGVLSNYCFSLTFVNPESLAPLASKAFALEVPFPTQTTSIALTAGSRVLAAVTVPPHAPQVNFTSPKAGDTWNEGTQTISWSASDQDGNPLTYALSYSVDGGNSYIPIDVDLTDTQVTLDSSSVSGSPQVYFHLMATDGVNTTASTVGPVTVVQTPKIALAATSVDFGNATVSAAVGRSLLVMSAGTGPMTVTSISSNNPMFSLLTPAVPFTLNVGDQISIGLQFLPASTGSESGMLTLTSSDPSSPSIQVALSGTGFANAVQDWQLTPATVDFGSVGSGQTSNETVLIFDDGTADLQVSSMSISNSHFQITSPSTPYTVSAGTQQPIVIQFTSDGSGQQNGTLTISSNDPTHATRTVMLTGMAVASLGPQIAPGGIVNAASSAATVARGSLASIYGTNLTAASPSTAGSFPLPLNFGGTSVTVGGVPAPIYYVQSTQMNIQIPYQAPLGASVPVVVTSASGVSNTVNVAIADYALGVFQYSRTGSQLDPIITHANYSLITPGSPAVPGETVIVFATGIGKLNNPPATGAAASASPLSTAVDTPSVTVGGAPAGVLFAGLAPGLAGLAQLDIQLPANLPSGSLPLQIIFPGDTGPAVNIAVQGNVTTPTCSFALSPTSASVPAGASTGNTVTVTASASSCAWTAVSGAAWITITSGASGSGSGQVTYSAAANTGAARSGVILIAGLSFTVNQAAGTTLPDTTTGLVGWWKFDESSGATVTDSSGHGNGGTIVGGVTRVPGIFGGALSFDGSTGMIDGGSPGTAFPTGSSARTISAWIMITNPPTVDNAILHYGTYGGAPPAVNFHLFVTGAGSKVAFGNGYGFGVIDGTTSVADGQWHNVAGVYEGPGTNVARIYVDGIQQFSGTLLDVPDTGNQTPWRIGNFLAGGGFFSGLMDDVRIYGRALSTTDLQAVFAGQ
jgi:uncharacterized protein (TIGR03437 family)